LVRIGPVTTTHPEPGARNAHAPPPPTKIRDLLPQLADLAEASLQAPAPPPPTTTVARSRSSTPKSAEVALRAEVARLTQELHTLRARHATPSPPPPPVRVEVPVPVVLGEDLATVQRISAALAGAVEQLSHRAAGQLARIAAGAHLPPGEHPILHLPRSRASVEKRPMLEAVVSSTNGEARLHRGAREMLAMLVAHCGTLSMHQLAVLCRMHPRGSTLRTYRAQLLKPGYVVGDHPQGSLSLTPE
jgi:hypothetical protein